KRREQQSEKLRKCSVAWARQNHTQAIRERVGITIVHQRDPGILTLDLRPRKGSSDGPHNKQYSQPQKQHSYFLHFRILHRTEINNLWKFFRRTKNSAFLLLSVSGDNPKANTDPHQNITDCFWHWF